MKIAFCLSGGPRFKNRGLFRLVDALKGFDQADFFIRTWRSDEYGNTADEFVDYLRREGIDTRCNFPVVNILEDNADNAPPPKPPLNIAPWAPNFLTMWWGIVESHRLFKEYVDNTGTKYDMVFRMRTDMVPEGDIDLIRYTDPTKIYNAKNFEPGKTPIYYSGPYWDHRETEAAIDAFLNGKWITAGEKVHKFESRFAKKFNQKYAHMVNSGSSANLVLIAALKKRFSWQDDDEIIVSPVGFATTVSVLYQNRLKPVFVDIEWDTLNFDINKIEEKITSKTKGIFVSPVLGNPPNMDRLKEIADKYGILLIGILSKVFVS